MNRVKDLYERTKGLSKEDRSKMITEFMKNTQQDETFLKDMLAFGDKISADMDRLNTDIDKAYNENKLAWLNNSWVNQSEICLKLYGKKDNTTTGLFSQKRAGKRRWKAEELERLEEIRKELIDSLAVH